MADVRTFNGFKDWALVLLLGGNIAMQFNINSTVNKLATNDAVGAAMYEELKKSHQELKSEFSAMKSEQRETDKEVARMQEYIRPNEVKEQRRLSNR